MNNFIDNFLKIIKRVFRWIRVNSKVVLPITALSICFLVFLYNVVKSPQVRRAKEIKPAVSQAVVHKINQFNHIDAELIDLKNRLDAANHDGSQNTMAINARLNHIQKQLLDLNIGKGIQQVNHEISMSHNDLSEKITNLQNLVEIIKKQIMPVKYLNASVLPFKVISVDIWNGVPYAAVTIDKKSKLIGKNETINHWMLVDLDYAVQQVVFRKNKQYVKVRVSV